MSFLDVGIPVPTMRISSWLGPGRWQNRLVIAVVLLVLVLYLYETYDISVRRNAVKASSHSKINLDHDATEAAFPTVNLVVSSRLKDDISWTENLRIPNLSIVRYVSDYLDAEFHPPIANRGHEALVYHTYFHDFYDNLPDISILIHGHETSWHVEDMFNRSMTFALSHLDLNEILQRQYFNLRVRWDGACPAWNTTFERRPDDPEKPEKLYEAFSENFATYDVPEMLGGPCCSQFAVTRDAIRRNSQAQYRRTMDWFMQTGWDDSITGRVWEHMWPWLFTGEPVDCPMQFQTYCQMYHICFEQDAAILVDELAQEKKILKEQITIPSELLNPQRGQDARKRLKVIESLMQTELGTALERGRNGSSSRLV
ncbi:hypothetical protein F5Y16DRAFT_127703 [Xylariaceae sp. FL0255]|nr:hypothetical protein F5Y16DRAFT_127703 [Xylariaceae sp. FL0255]